MKVLVAVVAWILAINVAYAAWLAISEFVRGRRARREVGTLDAMWQLPEVPRGARRRPSRVLAGALAVVVLGGVAIATPAGEEVVSTVGDAIGNLRGEPEEGEIAVPDDDALSSPDASPTREPSTSPSPSGDPRDHPRGNGGGPGEVTDDPGRDPTSSPATSPDDGMAPPVDASPSPSTSPEPSPPPPIVGTFASDATPLSDTEISVTWSRVRSATAYAVQRSDAGGAPLLVADVSAGKRDVVVSGLSPETTYDFTITAVSGDGVLATSSTSATTLPAVES